MGYGLSMDGRSTFEALVEREGHLGRRPYSSYCFLLAMDADAEALRFLSRYARDLDDVTGEAIAFIALVDRITLDGTFRPNPRWRDQTARAHLGPDLEATYEIFEDRSTRVEVKYGGWRSRWRISGRKSVDFARACEVSLAELPCLVIFDAETLRSGEGGGALVVPVDSYEGRAFEIVRSACSDFYDQNHAHPLLVDMRSWDSLTQELGRLSDRITSLSHLRSWTERSRLVDDVIGELRRAGVIGEDETLPEIDEGLVQKVDEFLVVIGDAITSLQGWKAMKIVDRESVLRTLGPELAAVSDLSARTDMALVMERLQRMNRMALDKRHECARSLIDAAMARIDAALERARVAHGKCEDARADVARKISQTGRPRFTPFVEDRLMQDRREVRRTNLKVRAAEAGGWLRSILDAISGLGSQLPG